MPVARKVVCLRRAAFDHAIGVDAVHAARGQRAGAAGGRPEEERLAVVADSGRVDIGVEVGVGSGFAVGNRVTPVPPHRSVRAGFPHTAPTLGV
jgi:hypothetical protein